MCLRPLKFRTPSKVLDFDGGQSAELTCNCGKCAECQKAKSDEWYFRSYYEFMDCVESGGYVLFDTLTYSDENLPRLSAFFPDLEGHPLVNFPIFSREDVRLFMVRLRRALKRAGYDPANKLHYFLSSEYGTSEFHTHRPHYHILFFVLQSFVSYDVLSRLISECWDKGRTDGIPFQSASYVFQNRVYDKSAGNDITLKVCNYVCKYVQKDSKFESVVRKRLGLLYDYCSKCVLVDGFRPVVKLVSGNAGCYDAVYKIEHASCDGRLLPLYEPCKILNRRLSNVEFMLDPSNKHNFFRVLNRHALQFHLQSNGFGSSWLETADLDEIFKTGKITIPCNIPNKPTRSLPLPLYYRRKLFFDLVKNVDGNMKWTLNDLGVKYQLSRANDVLDSITKRFEDWFNNIPSLIQDIRYNDKENERRICNFVERVSSCLAGRSWRDFATYVAFYKGRIRPRFSIDSGLPVPLDNWLPLVYSNRMPTNYVLVYAMSKVNSYDFSLSDDGYDSEYNFFDTYVYNSHNTLCFVGFDELFSLYADSNKSLSDFKQKTFERVQELRARHKAYKNNKPFNYN